MNFENDLNASGETIDELMKKYLKNNDNPVIIYVHGNAHNRLDFGTFVF
jgi:hypothetical protein